MTITHLDRRGKVYQVKSTLLIVKHFLTTKTMPLAKSNSLPETCCAIKRQVLYYELFSTE
jgi:hypothetical protein